jgi:hypothetical protein
MIEHECDRQNNKPRHNQGCLIFLASALSFGMFIMGTLLGIFLTSKICQPESILPPNSSPPIPKSSPVPIVPSTPLRSAIVNLNVSGLGNNISIFEGTQQTESGSFNVTGQGQDFSFYMAAGTKIKLSISGQGNTVYIDKELRESWQIVSQSGLGNQVIIRDN